MVELPEAIVLARQINQTLPGKRITKAIAGQSPHKFAWYSGDPAEYNTLLAGKTIRQATACAGEIEVAADEMRIVTSVALRYYPVNQALPPKHQLLLQFEDGTALAATVQMYGIIYCVREGEPLGFQDYRINRERPSPLSDAFDQPYFDQLIGETDGNLSVKAFLTTEQRIPGLGNGVLQDILWTAQIHPKRKMETLSLWEIGELYHAVKTVLLDMANQGGRNTERDLFGCPGGYKTILSKNTVGMPCPVCGAIIKKEAYQGGSIYFCPKCQKESERVRVS
jgi:formamidopyrimidine-DNA glycosylase